MAENEKERRWFSSRGVLWSLVWLATLAGAFLAGVFAYRHRQQIRALFQSVQSAPVIQTNLYNLRVEQVPIPAEGRDGGIAALEGGILFVNRMGEFWYVDSTKQLRSLDLQVPVNISEFQADPYNDNTVNQELFGVKDLLVQRLPDGLRILASHNHWNAEDDCNVLRVSATEMSAQDLLEGSGEASWETVFDTRPCIELGVLRDGETRMPSLAAGGRMGPMSESEILLTVGGMSPDPDPDGKTESGELNSYGKTILIDLETGEDRIYTYGHRNPQGLAVDSDGRVWETEHGDRGGDELNLLIDGRDYGYPHVSYGTAYESMTWPGSPAQGRHPGYERPMFAWAPAIGPSQLIVIEGDRFPYWKGDLIVSTLRERSLYRIRFVEDRVVLVEPMFTGHRIRDIVEADNGAMVLKTDDDFLLYIEPLDASDPSELTTVEYGTVLAAQCQACHTFTQEGPNSIGPNLWGVVGREVGTIGGYDYSQAMQTYGGRWTRESLRAFLARPDSVIPGTSMPLATQYAPDELDALVAYLETLR